MKWSPATYIRPVAIKLPQDYQFDNLPHGLKDVKDEKPYVGKKELIRKFIKMLESGTGVYLVTGFRGMGKTSFVNQVISEFNKQQENLGLNRLLKIVVTLSHGNPTEVDVLRMMVSSLRERCAERLRLHLMLKRLISAIWKQLGILSVCLVFLFLIDGTNFHNKDFYNELAGNDGLFTEKAIKTALLRLLFCSTAITILSFALDIFFSEFNVKINLWNRLDDLYKRCHSAASIENEGSGELAVEIINTKILQQNKKRTDT